MVLTHNVHINGLVPVLWKLLRMKEYQNGRIESLILGKKYSVSKLKPGFHLIAMSKTPFGLKIMARNDRKTQIVSTPKLLLVLMCYPRCFLYPCCLYVLLVPMLPLLLMDCKIFANTSLSKEELQEGLDAVIGRKQNLQ